MIKLNRNIRRIGAISWITLVLIVLITILTVPNLALFADEIGDAAPTDAYDFPIKPGTEEWKAFRTHVEMLNACQIPDSVLKDMSTAGLVETVSNYPLLVDMWAYNDVQIGFEAVASHFNGIPELISREDAATELISKYKAIDLNAISGSWSPLEQGRFVLGTVSSIEMLLAQDCIISKMSEAERLDLLAEVRINCAVKQQKGEFYGETGLEISSLIVEGLTLRHWSERCTSSHVYTPQGTWVGAYYWVTGCPEWTISQKVAVDAYYLDLYPAAWKWGTYSSTKKYNCHSYAWHQQHASNLYWINNPAAYMTDGSYYYKGQFPTGWQEYRKIFYDAADGPLWDHSGICYWYWDGANMKGVTSKWGSGPLMNHLHNYCPYDYSNCKIYG